ncbi:MAG: hypothetical protein V3U54_08895 [Thermodesulfobacteriota bacterium]
MFKWVDKLFYPKKQVQFPDGSIDIEKEIAKEIDKEIEKKIENLQVTPGNVPPNLSFTPGGAHRLADMSPGDTASFSFASQGKEVANVKPGEPYKITFYVENKKGKNQEVGWINLANGKVEFGGNIDESAKALFEVFKPLVDKYLYDKVRKINKLDEIIKGDLEK